MQLVGCLPTGHTQAGGGKGTDSEKDCQYVKSKSTTGFGSDTGRKIYGEEPHVGEPVGGKINMTRRCLMERWRGRDGREVRSTKTLTTQDLQSQLH